MRSGVKKTLITAAVLCVVGIIVGAIGFCLMGYSFDDLKQEPLTESTYTFTEDINLLGITTDTSDVELILTDGGETKVVCREDEEGKFNAYVKTDTLGNKILYVELAYKVKRWYEHIEVSGIFGTTEEEKITVYLPKAEYDACQIETDTGDVTIPAGLTFTSLVAKADTGDINFYSSVKDVLWIGTNTGDITVKDSSVGTLRTETDTGKISISSTNVSGTMMFESDTGNIYFENVNAKNLTADSGTGDVVLSGTVIAGVISIETDTGDVRFSSSDGGTLCIETDTGDVKGTLLTEKIFLVETDTGRVNVPKTVTGGKCEITTDTGDIKITIENP